MPVTISSSNTRTGVSTSVDSLNIGAGAGVNRFLLVCVGWADADLVIPTLQSIDDGGSALTQYATYVGGGMHNEIWYLASPPSGVQTITVTFSDIATYGIFASLWHGVDQNNPLEAVAQATDSSDSPSLSVVNYSIQDAILDCMTIFHGPVVATRTATGQAQVKAADLDISYDVNANYSVTCSRVNGAVGGAGATSYSLSASRTWVMQSVRINHKKQDASPFQYRFGKT